MNFSNRPSIRFIALAVLLCAAPGCFVLEREYPEKTLHLVAFQTKTGVDEQSMGGPGVEVQTFRISPGFDTRELVVRTGETEYEPDFYNEYFVPPADALRSAARDAITESSAFRGVASNTVYQLHGNIRRLGGDVRDPSAPTAYLDIQLLIRQGTRGSVLHERSFVIEEPVADDSSEEIFEGLCRATTRALRDFVAGAAAKLPPDASSTK